MAKDFSSYEEETGFRVSEHEAQWSSEDKKLRDWIAACSAEEAVGLLDVLKEAFNNDVSTYEFFKLIKERYPANLTRVDIQFAASFIVHELREYSGRTLMSSVPYEKTLTKVHKRLGKHFKVAVPEVASTRAREEAIATMMLGDAAKELKPEELQSALSGVEFDGELTAEKNGKSLFRPWVQVD